MTLFELTCALVMIAFWGFVFWTGYLVGRGEERRDRKRIRF